MRMGTFTTSISTFMRAKLPLRELVSLSLIGALLVASKELMAFLPNIEPVTLILMSATLVYGLRALYPCYVFVMLEGLLYGLGLWFINYLYIWALLVIGTHLMRRNTSWVIWTVAAGLYGLFFGALCAIPYFFIGGWRMAFSYWIAGIPFDMLHLVGNILMTGIFLKPLTGLLQRLAAGQYRFWS